MVAVVSPSGTVATVDQSLAEVLLRKGWTVPGKPDPKQAPVKRKPGRPRKTE